MIRLKLFLFLILNPKLKQHYLLLAFLDTGLPRVASPAGVFRGMDTNGTYRSHARCHPNPIPQPVKVDHTTGVYVPYPFRIVMWFILRPTRTDQ